jgi:hypothetical protein
MSPSHPFAPVVSQSVVSPVSKSRSRTLTKKERDAAQIELVAFGESVRLAEHGLGNHGYCPCSSFFSLPTISLVLEVLLMDVTAETLQATLANWPYFDSHGVRLLELLHRLRADIKKSRTYAQLLRNANAQATRAMNKVIPPPSRVPKKSLATQNSRKRTRATTPPLVTVTNETARPIRNTRQRLVSVKDTAETYGPKRNSSRRPVTIGDENLISGVRRSARLTR